MQIEKAALYFSCIAAKHSILRGFKIQISGTGLSWCKLARHQVYSYFSQARLITLINTSWGFHAPHFLLIKTAGYCSVIMTRKKLKKTIVWPTESQQWVTICMQQPWPLYAKNALCCFIWPQRVLFEIFSGGSRGKWFRFFWLCSTKHTNYPVTAHLL